MARAQIRIANRTAEKAQAIAAEFGSGVTAVDWAARDAALADVALLINCTDQGMIGKPALEIDLARLAPTTLVADLIYTPLETPFLADARDARLRHRERARPAAQSGAAGVQGLVRRSARRDARTVEGHRGDVLKRSGELFRA